MWRARPAQLFEHVGDVRVEATAGERSQYAELPVACIAHVLVLCALEVVETLDRDELALGLGAAAEDCGEGASGNRPKH